MRLTELLSPSVDFSRRGCYSRAEQIGRDLEVAEVLADLALLALSFFAGGFSVGFGHDC